MAFQFFHQTQSSGTPIIQVIPPETSRKVKLTSLVYTAGATAHDLIIMRAGNKVLTTAAQSAAGTTLVLDSASFVGQSIASGDYLIVQHSDGTYGAYLASGLSTLTVTIGALAKNVSSGAPVWIMGSISEAWHSTLKSIASTRLTLEDAISGIAESGWNDGTSYSRGGLGDPLMIYSANGTNAGTLDRGGASYY